MKKLITFTLLLSFVLPFDILAQYETGTGQGELLNGTHQFAEVTRFSKLMSKKRKKNDNLIGHPYVYEKWARAEVNFDQEGVVALENVKIDILNNYLEVKIDGVEKILDKDHFSSLKIANPEDGEMLEFVNAEDYSVEGNQLQGFLKRRKAENFEVLTHYRARISSVGRSDISDYKSKMRLTKKTRTYLSKDGNLVRIKKKKDLYKVFTKNPKKLKSYIKKNNLSHKNESHLVLMALYYQEKI